MLTKANLESKEPSEIGGTQRIYRFKGGWGLSLINSPSAHHYPFAWEAAVLKPGGGLCYSTLLTGDVEVFQTDKEANQFIEKARKHFEGGE